ncbi:hypothetical protein [Mycolicibacterium vaccae]|uniref:hypothetical protein n=1 Tax=Mycolicibacterium vaccae TaxID=1810 RepID=UPI003CFD172B
MTTDEIADRSASGGWDFSSLAPVWDATTKAILVGARHLEALPDREQAASLSALSRRVRTLTRDLDDSWLVATALFMVDDLYKSCFHEFRWSPGVGHYVGATAGTFLDELAGRGYVLHYVIDNIQTEDRILDVLGTVRAVIAAAGLMVTGPQLMALELMDRTDGQSRDVNAMAGYRAEGHYLADMLVQRCHLERRHSLYLNLDLDDDLPALALDVALSQAATAGTIVVFRNQPPAMNSLAQIAVPPGLTLPDFGSS